MKNEKQERKLEEVLEDVKPYLEPGQFQRAVTVYENAGLKDKAKEASLACAADCLEVGLYGRAIEYFEKGGKKDTAKWLGDILGRGGIEPNLALETRPCMPSCQKYTWRTRGCKATGNLDEILGYIRKQNYMEKAKQGGEK